MSYFSQMTQLAFHNFVSAAAGIARGDRAGPRASRGARRAGSATSGWISSAGRSTCFSRSRSSSPCSSCSRACIQNFEPYLDVTTLEGAKQTIAMGPVASQEAIKQLGTNGGGFFNANSAHPFENPTPLDQLLVRCSRSSSIPAALTYTLGRMVQNQRHGWALWAAMFVLFFAGVTTAYWAEARGNPIHAARGVDVVASASNPGGNMEGKEVRFGIANSALYATVTTDASCGAVNAMHDSFTPIGGLVPLVNIQLGELVFGGVGAGLYGMLDDGRAHRVHRRASWSAGRRSTWARRSRRRECRWRCCTCSSSRSSILALTARLRRCCGRASQGLNNAGPHGLSEILYAFTSTPANNGSAFAGLTGTTYYYNTLFGVATLVGRFAMIVPMLALGGLPRGEAASRPSPPARSR